MIESKNCRDGTFLGTDGNRGSTGVFRPNINFKMIITVSVGLSSRKQWVNMNPVRCAVNVLVAFNTFANSLKMRFLFPLR